MRRKTLVFLLLFTVLIFNAQYIKMPLDTNRAWKQSWFATYTYPVNASYNSVYQLKVKNDTIINGITYNVLKRTTISYYSSNGGYYSPGPVIQFLRQDTILKRVIILSGSQEKIIYNFNKIVGDTANLFFYGSVSTYTLQHKDSVLLNDGLYHKRYNFLSNSAGGVIEGVGSSYGLLTPYGLGYGTGDNLDCMAKINPSIQTIYSQGGNNSSCAIVTNIKDAEFYKNLISLYPNPSDKVVNIKTDGVVPKSIEIIDLLGVKIFFKDSFTKENNMIDVNSFPQGIYFIKVNIANTSVVSRFIKIN